MTPRRATAGAVLALTLLGAGCSTSDGGPHPTPTARSATTTAGRAAPGGCPNGYAAPDPHRPRLTLTFDIAADHRHVTGHERVAFTPDRPVTELVFRLTANSPGAASASGTRTTVTTATADHGGSRFRVTAAGAAAGSQGGLLHIPFAHTVAAGTTVRADIAFTLTLGPVVPYAFPRSATDDGFAYFGSGAPLLAWQRGFGWHTENLVGFPAETATSEAMALDLTVTAPAADVVIASGDPAPSAPAGGRRTWHATLPAARDVSVAAGPFSDVTTRVGSVTLHVGAYSSTQRDLMVAEFRRAVTALTARFGPFPFPSLSVARVPVDGGGIEYPSSILMLDSSRLVAVHETAHQWFYALVGDSQALHAWLDEGFAQYAEQLVDGSPSTWPNLAAGRPVDTPISAYGTDADAYYSITYDKAAAALAAARRAAGPAAWDAALRCYVRANAWRVATPDDLARALRALPAAVAVLRRAGALR